MCLSVVRRGPRSMSRPIVLEGGRLKHIWVDKMALSEGNPAWVIEEATGLCRRHKGASFVIVGSTLGAGHQIQPLHEGGPVLWLETEAEVRFFP